MNENLNRYHRMIKNKEKQILSLVKNSNEMISNWDAQESVFGEMCEDLHTFFFVENKENRVLNNMAKETIRNFYQELTTYTKMWTTSSQEKVNTFEKIINVSASFWQLSDELLTKYRDASLTEEEKERRISEITEIQSRLSDSIKQATENMQGIDNFHNLIKEKSDRICWEVVRLLATYRIPRRRNR